MLLEEWLSTPMTEAKITTAAPIIATTITLEAIQNLLFSNGYPVEGNSIVTNEISLYCTHCCGQCIDQMQKCKQ
jgi:hypothetical protein